MQKAKELAILSVVFVLYVLAVTFGLVDGGEEDGE